MHDSEPITEYLERCKAGDPEGARKLWDLYFRRLVGLARRRLAGGPPGVVDGEDVALSAICRFIRGAEQGRFPELHNREQLWRLLVTITVRKAVDAIRHETPAGKVCGEVQGDSVLLDTPAQEPQPEFTAEAEEECRRLLDRLGDAELRAIAVWKMEGYTSEEIAGRMGCTLRTVERRLGLIRKLWSDPKP
jgi:RNA polymerase sigma factor (sigma-70 family)